MAKPKTFTLNIARADDHLEVSIPEIGAVVSTSGTTLQEAEDAGHLAIIEHELKRKKHSRKKKRHRTA